MSDTSACSVLQSNRGWSADPSAFYYYEVMVCELGAVSHASAHGIAIGVAPRKHPLSRCPGWEGRSYGYCRDGSVAKGECLWGILTLIS